MLISTFLCLAIPAVCQYSPRRVPGATYPGAPRGSGGDLETLRLKNMPLADVLLAVLGGVRSAGESGKPAHSYVVHPEIAKIIVTAVVKNVERETALSEILKGAGAKRLDLHGLLVVVPLWFSLPDDAGLGALLPGYGARAGKPSVKPEWAGPLTADFRAIPLPEAISKLLQQRGIAYVQSPDLPLLPVTAVLNQVPLSAALDAILRVSYARAELQADGSVSFVPAAGGGVSFGPFGTPTPRVVAPTPTAGEQPTSVMTMALRFANPADMAPFLALANIEGIANVQSAGHNLILRGTERAIAEAKDLVSSLDVPTRAVSIKLELEATVSRGGGEKPTVYRVSTESTGAEDSAIPLNLIIDRPRAGNAGSVSGKLEATLTPVVAGDDSITVSGSGQAHLSIQIPDVTAPLMLSKTFDVAAGLEPQKPQVITSGSLDVSGDGVCEFRILVQAAVQGNIVRKATTMDFQSYGGSGGFGYGGFTGSGGGYGSVATPGRLYAEELLKKVQKEGPIKPAPVEKK